MYVPLCVTDLVKSQFVLWSVYCCSAAIQKKELKGLRSDESCSNRSFEQSFLLRKKKKPTFFSCYFQKLGCIRFCKALKKLLQLLAKQEADVNRFYFHNSTAADRILKISAILLPVRSPLFADVDQCDRCCHDSCLRAERERAAWSRKSSQIPLVSPAAAAAVSTLGGCGSSWQAALLESSALDQLSAGMLSSCQGRGALFPHLHRLPFSWMLQTSCGKTAF